MYHDLESKHKSYCRNEPEFRAYMVLMKLNEGDILRYIVSFIITARLVHTVKCGRQCVLTVDYVYLLFIYKLQFAQKWLYHTEEKGNFSVLFIALLM